MARKNVTEKLNDILGVAKEVLHEDKFSVSSELENIKEISKEIQTMPSTELLAERMPRIKPTDERIPDIHNDDLENDYAYTRNVLRGLIHNGELTLDALLCVAQDMQNPRAYEVAGQLINTISAVTTELIKLQKTMKELKGNKDEAKGQVVNAENVQQNTYIFNGTTAELQKIMREQLSKQI